MSNLDAFRAAGNPVFNDNKPKLGTFGSNCSNARAITPAETSLEPTFEKNLEIAKLLETSGMECMVPIARWRGPAPTVKQALSLMLKRSFDSSL